MERRELTKEDIDKVRDIEGFPIGTDEDIIALSDAPYYTACPNPYIEEFIKKNTKTSDSDEYHREPYASDVSEGKGDAIYNAHSYHTKVPYKAIMKYILHYTSPGDIVFDGFCGTGMTGVAAQMCGSNNSQFRYSFEAEEKGIEWGARKAVLMDLSPAATFVAYNYNFPVKDLPGFKKRCEDIFRHCREKYDWMYRTTPDEGTQNQLSLSVSEDRFGKVNYTIWSDVFICPNCGKEYVYWDVAVDAKNKGIRKTMHCPSCNIELNKRTSERAFNNVYDDVTGNVISVGKQVPVLINYSFNGSRYDKKPDSADLALLEKVASLKTDYWYPKDRMCEGKEARRNDAAGITRVDQFYTKRNIIILSEIYHEAEKLEKDEKLALLGALRGAMSYGTKMVKVNIGRLLNGGGTFSFGAVTGTLYMPSITAERPILEAIENKTENIQKVFTDYPQKHGVIIGTGSLTDAKSVPNNSVDYIFTDPPFGDNLNYAELNYLWESWGKVTTNTDREAIVDTYRGKGIFEYQELMTKSFAEYYRTLKPNHWITVEFHNSKNAVWNAIQEALAKVGFIIADVRTLDKQQGSFKQTTTTSAVKQDLVISAYKPHNSFLRDFELQVGTEESAWSFVRQHLSNLPVVVDADGNGKLDIVSERQAFLLFDRMVSYHIMQGYAVPLDATDFYKGLDDHFLKRDGMYFLPDQVNEYDMARSTMEVENIQFSLFVSDEKSAIGWLYQQLDENSGLGPTTYAELQPKFMQELKALDKREKMPELSEILEENFLKDDKGRWYIPDLTKSGDLAKLREKNLLKEFQSYLESKGKLKVFRSEAIRAGFAKLWKDKDYSTIVKVAERLPEQTIQEDPNLLMYYDISLGRI